MKKSIFCPQRIITILTILIINISIAQQSNSFNLLFTGNTSENQSKNVALLNNWQKISQSEDNLAFLLLGNIYDSKNSSLSDYLYKDTQHALLLTPGAKEWASGGSDGKELVKEIKKELEQNYAGKVYMPKPGCPGPTEVILNDHLVIILLDTHWWVHSQDRRYSKCDIISNGDVLVQIEDAIRRHHGTKHVVLAGHHSLKSYGNSGGYFSAKQYIFEAPYTFYRKIFGSAKDNHHPEFKGFRDLMLSILQKYPNIIYISAGDDNLQYFTADDAHYIISGSMQNTGYVSGGKPEFGISEKGFGRLRFSDDGNCELVFTGKNDELFRKTIYNKIFIDSTKQLTNLAQFPDNIKAQASQKYDISNSQYWLKGENYRSNWSTPINVPVLNIRKEKGGLKVLQRGGGFQTLSLRLEDKNKKQFVIRSIDKNVSPMLVDELKNTFVAELFQDQISTSNPYAALVAAKLADYAGIYHTNPKVVYAPDDPNFGIYQKDVAGKLFLFEERPAGDRSDVDSFGNSNNIISSADMIENILDDNKHRVDSDSYLRARLLDLLLNDWDRHEDQWRWASFESDDKTIYKPIPRDRDQAFIKIEGLIMWIVSQQFPPKFHQFDEYTEKIEGLGFQARYLDRNFMIQSDWSDWKRQIDFLKTALTPERIDEAVLSFPKEVQPLSATETASVLKARLSNLEPMVKNLYLFLAKEVDITGSNKKDLFEIETPNKSTMKITGYTNGKDNIKEDIFFQRTFKASETNIINIYGFNKKDRFIIKGIPKHKIDLTIIGGGGNDEIVYDGSKSPSYVKIYDKKSTITTPVLSKCLKSKYYKKALKYNRTAFLYNSNFPILAIGYNQDDGLFLGGQTTLTKYSRYHQQKYTVGGTYAVATNAYNFQFMGKHIHPLSNTELSLQAEIKAPNFVNNYFGLGNESTLQTGKPIGDYYRVRMKEYLVKTDYTKFLDRDKVKQSGVGVFYKNIDVEETQNRLISDFENNDLNKNQLLGHAYAGAYFNFKMNSIANREIKGEDYFGGSNMFRTRGTQFESEISYFKGLNDESSDFTKFVGSGTSYFSFSKRPRVVYALQLGGEKIFGDYLFTESAKLGQSKNLRGYRKTRFYGDASIYLNTEIRIRINQFSNYILGGTAGLFFFNDIGRVWLEGEDSNRWHDGYGAGLWWSLFDMFMLSFSFEKSTEDDLIALSFNYQF